MSFEAVKEKLEAILRDSADTLSTTDLDEMISAAVSQYSKDKPLIKIKDILGDGGYEYDVPTDWSDGFSTIITLEYPLGNQSPTLLSNEMFFVYKSETAIKIRFVFDSPTASETFRLTYSIPHTLTPSESSIYLSDLNALAYLSASFACKALARHYAQVSEPTFAADAVNYNDKSSSYSQRASELYKDYRRFLAVDQETLKAEVGIMDLDHPAYEHEYLTHEHRKYR